MAALAVLAWLTSSDADTDVAPTPAPAPLAAAPPPAAPAPAAPPSAEGLRLFGLLGGGAIIATQDGAQRFVAIGREVRPGLRVARIEAQHVVLASTGGEVQLGFDGPRAPAAGPTAAAAATPIAPAEAAQREETTAYRLGLEPLRENGQVMGHRVRPGASLPALQRAGIRPGDIIRSVGGSRFDEERMLELAWTIANSERLELEVERDGRRLRLSLKGGSH
jgi:type II secretion system protein C